MGAMFGIACSSGRHLRRQPLSRPCLPGWCVSRSLWPIRPTESHAQIERIGRIASKELDSAGATLVIADSAPILGDCNVGDSIAVNGACLTVVEFDKQEKGGWFKVWLANETLDRTDLGEHSLALRRPR
jgi:hypothetical protein